MIPLVSLIFLKRSLVFSILLFSSTSLHWSLRKAFLSLLAILWNSTFKWTVWAKLSWTVFLILAGLTQMPAVRYWVCLGLPDPRLPQLAWFSSPWCGLLSSSRMAWSVHMVKASFKVLVILFKLLFKLWLLSWLPVLSFFANSLPP